MPDCERTCPALRSFLKDGSNNKDNNNNNGGVSQTLEAIVFGAELLNFLDARLVGGALLRGLYLCSKVLEHSS